MFLTIGQTQKYPKYYNPCGSSIENAVKFSVANEVKLVAGRFEMRSFLKALTAKVSLKF
jgi:hypothetical protein